MNTKVIDNQVRHIELQGKRANKESKKFPNNCITTSKYTLLSFLPKVLLHQFYNPSKLWFLFISVIEVAGKSDITYSYGTLIPLTILLFMQITRDGVREFSSHLADREINYRTYPVWDGSTFIMKFCKEILVGDILLLVNNDIVPADLVLLSVGNEEHNCYVDASDIIGEKSLKIKNPVRETQNIINSIDLETACSKLVGLDDDLFVSGPSQAFKHFVGKVKLSIAPSSSEIGLRNVLLRDMRIMHTPWLFGIAAYTGVETKIWINNLERPEKVPALTRILEKWLLWSLLVIIVISIVNTIVFQWFSVGKYRWNEVFLGNLLLFNHIVPISLALLVELIKLFLNRIISGRNPRITLNSPDLCSNLGMVEYVITDKTGTLTENCLKVALCVVDNRLYVDNNELTSPDNSDRNGSEEGLVHVSRILSSYPGDLFSFTDLQVDMINKQETREFMHFFYCIALCNLAFPQDQGYIALSEDDKALAQAAANFGFKVIARDEDSCVIQIFEEEVMFYVLGTQAFSSVHKKSRIIVKQSGASEVYMYIKGTKRAMKNIFEDSLAFKDYKKVIVEYRSLYLAYKLLNRREVKQFMFEYGNAKMSLVNKEGRVESVFEKFDKNATFLGIVGLEDKVADDTIQAISSLKEAGIKFWLLSGDSEDSTVTSALASGIIPHNAKILRLVGLTSELDCLNFLESYTKEYIFPVYASAKESVEVVGKIRAAQSNMNFSPCHSPAFNPEENGCRGEEKLPTQVARNTRRRSSVHPVISKLSIYKHLTSLQGKYEPKDLNFALSIDSRSFEFCLESTMHLKYFVFLLFTAKAVCFHNLLPDQKSKVIKLISRNLRFNPLVLAIGDSLSEIGMIQQAHVGVAIEGTAAANNADVVIQKFGDLQNLLLVHGHSQYVQTSKMILVSIYAMALLEFQLAFYNTISGWNGSSVFDKNFLLVYKFIISILPIAGLCLFDKQTSSTTTAPQAYRIGIFNRLLTVRYLIYYILTALVQSICTFVFSLIFFPGISADAATENLLLLDISVFLVISSTVVLGILLETYSFSPQILTIYVFSVFLQCAVIIPVGYYYSELIGYPEMLVKFQICWVYIVPASAFNVGIAYCFKSVRYVFFPDSLSRAGKDSPHSNLNEETRLDQYRKEISKVFRESAEFKRKRSYKEPKLNVWMMRFTSQYMERAYQEDKYTENLKSFRIHLIVAALFIFTYSMTVLFENLTFTVVVIYLCTFCGVFAFAGLLPWVNSFRDFAAVYIVIYFISIQTYLMLLQTLFSVYSLSLVVILPVIGFIGFSNYWLYMTLSQLVCTVFVGINAAYCFSALSLPTSEIVISTVSYTIIYLTLLCIFSVISYHIDKSKREEFLLVQTVELEMQKSKSVLNYLLPAFVRKRVKDGVRFISENQGVVSIIFCDICNFESILKDYDSMELTGLLDDIFGKFDQICIQSGCTKIETVGKTYMACAGLKEPELELEPYYTEVPHARRCVEMALSLLEATESIFLRNGESLSLHIGVNSGPVTAGVVGYHKPQFSLVGDTVNTSSRMASLCPGPNTIQISKDTYGLLGSTAGLICMPSVVEAKGKGRMDTFIVAAPEQQNDASALSAKHGQLSPSLSEMFSFRSNGGRSVNKIRNTTLSKFSFQHTDHEYRRSSLISKIESEVNVDNGYLRKETEAIEKVKWISCSCVETQKEQDFRLEISKTTYPIAICSLLLRIACDGLLLAIMTVNIIITNNYSRLFEEIRLILELVLTTALAVKLSKHVENPWLSWVLGLVYFAGAISKLGDEASAKDLIFIEYILHMVQIAHCSQLFFKNFIILGTLSWICYMVYACVIQFSGFSIQIIADTVCFIIILYTIHNRESGLRYYSVVTVAARKELKKTKELLEEMMPKHVFEILKEQNSVTERINNVSILYADIVGFTLWSSNKTPQQVVDMLSKLFTEFDRKCKKRKVYKVHTIGDCYVAMGYRDNGTRNTIKECLQMALFALDLVKIIRKVNDLEAIEPSLNMRIGLHTGDIIGGITGTSIVRYDIYGIDVIIANKMESTGSPGMVKISEDFMKILMENYDDRFIFKLDTEKPPVEIDRRKIHSYYLEVNPEYLMESRASEFSYDY